MRPASPGLSFRDEDFKTPTSGKNTRCHGVHCVSVAVKAGGVGVRDTKDSTKTTLVFTRDEWAAFLDGAKNGEFDLIETEK